MIYMDTRNDLLSILPKNMIMAELGVFTGQFSEVILNTCSPKELHLVDIWTGSMCSADKDGNGMITIPNMYPVYEGLVEKYAHNPVVHLHRMNTQKALAEFPNDYFDLIYIDAEHTDPACYADLQASFAKSKRYIAGHDYCRTFQGIINAVDRFCVERGLFIDILTKDGCPSFLIEKKQP